MTRLITCALLFSVLLHGCSEPPSSNGVNEGKTSASDDSGAVATLKKAGATFRMNSHQLITEVNLRKISVTSEVFEALSKLSYVTSVLLNDTATEDSMLLALKGWKSPVVNFDLRGCAIGNDGLATLTEFKTLKAIRLNEAADDVDDDGVAILAALPQLKVLALDGLWVGDDAVASLAKSNTLQELYLKGTIISDEALRTLGSMPSLRKLRLAATGITDDGLSHLAPLANLVELDLSENASLSNTGLESLAGLTSLQKLNLWRLPVGDQGILGLRHLKNLTWLNLDNTQLSDAGLDVLSDMNKLTFLHLGSTAITDDGLSKLAHLKNLRDLKITRTAVTEAGAFKLKALLPATEIQLLYIEGQ